MTLPLFGPPCEQVIDLLVDGKIRRGVVCGDTTERYGTGGLWSCEPSWAYCWKCPTCGHEQPLGPEFAGLRSPMLMTLEDDE